MADKFGLSFSPSPKSLKLRGISLATLLAIVLRCPLPKNRKAEATDGPNGAMTLHTATGARKYLNVAERQRFAAAADTMPPERRVFCLLLMWSGCRISEALAVTPMTIDREAGTIAFITLKRRKAAVVRQVPVPST